MRYTTERIREWLGEHDDLMTAMEMIEQLLADLELAESAIAAENAINLQLCEELEEATKELTRLRTYPGEAGDRGLS